jgi:hypothetical protein
MPNHSMHTQSRHREPPNDHLSIVGRFRPEPISMLMRIQRDVPELSQATSASMTIFTSAGVSGGEA